MATTRNELASVIAKREGKKVAVSIGNVREILRILLELDVECVLAGDCGPLQILADESDARIAALIAAKKKTRKKK